MAPNRVNQLLGKYRLMEYLGKGGFAEVYLGEHQNLKSYAALKVLHVTLTKDMADALLLEAQTLAQLVHPNIMRVLDYDTQDSTPFIVMEYVPGGTLRNHIPRGTRLPLSTIVFYVKQIASALQFAHSRSIIHRDVKPDNMLLATEQHILLSDFGLALFAPNQLSTQPGMESTIPYSAPEQLQGKPGRARSALICHRPSKPLCSEHWLKSRSSVIQMCKASCGRWNTLVGIIHSKKKKIQRSPARAGQSHRHQRRRSMLALLRLPEELPSHACFFHIRPPMKILPNASKLT